VHPIVVVALARPTTFGRTYTLITGHRRLAAARRAGWERVLARILPPCDLTAPAERLRLLAMALRENTEREPLAAEDRRAALRRLKDLYEAVYPTSRLAREATTATLAEAAPHTFARWAAAATHIPERTIRHDLRRVLIAPRPLSGVGAPPTLAQPASAAHLPAPDEDPLQTALQAGQHASTTLRTLADSLTPQGRSHLSPEQLVPLVQTLHDLQATLALFLTAATVPTARSLDAFALLLWQRTPPVTGALWGLVTSPRDDWTAAPAAVVETIHSTMATLLAGWAQVEPLLTAHASTRHGAPRPLPRLLTRSTQQEETV
jgi:hypothetical protein